MNPPVEHVRISSKSKEILIKVKRYTGLEHWNELCRVALCRSLANLTPPTKIDFTYDSTIDMDWKTFAGIYQEELSVMLFYRAVKDGIDITKKDNMSEYVRNHIERGILSLHSSKCLVDIVVLNI